MTFTCPYCGFEPPGEAQWRALCREWRQAGFHHFEHHFILDETKQPVPVCLLRHALYFEDESNRRVAQTFTELFHISTIFMGLNHQWGAGPPILFETMVFDREPHLSRLLGKEMDIHEDHERVRYSSWDDAMAGHKAMVRRYLKKEADAAEAIRKAREESENGR